jgi:hypothetical protein
VPKGYQICRSCGGLVPGPRTLVCAPSEVAEPVEMKQVFRFPDGFTFPAQPVQRVNVMTGECPIKLGNGVDFPADDEILNWALDVRQAMLNRGFYLTNPALAYWARHQINHDIRYSPLGDEVKYVSLIIKSLPDITTREVPAS